MAQEGDYGVSQNPESQLTAGDDDDEQNVPYAPYLHPETTKIFELAAAAFSVNMTVRKYGDGMATRHSTDIGLEIDATWMQWITIKGVWLRGKPSHESIDQLLARDDVHVIPDEKLPYKQQSLAAMLIGRAHCLHAEMYEALTRERAPHMTGEEVLDLDDLNAAHRATVKRFVQLSLPVFAEMFDDIRAREREKLKRRYVLEERAVHGCTGQGEEGNCDAERCENIFCAKYSARPCKAKDEPMRVDKDDRAALRQYDADERRQDDQASERAIKRLCVRDEPVLTAAAFASVRASR